MSLPTALSRRGLAPAGATVACGADAPHRGARCREAVVAALLALLALASLLLPTAVQANTLTSAVKDLTCAGARANRPANFTCTAGEFTVSPAFSAEPGTPPFCTAGAEFRFKVDLTLSGTNADRYDIGFFVGQQGNDPRATTTGGICSVATFPTSTAPVLSPWFNGDGDTCGDYRAGGTDTIRVDEIKVVCTGDATTGALAIPYLLTYRNNATNNASCAADNVNADQGSKCNAGTATVSGVVSVSSGAYVDVTKATLPAGDGQAFSFTATGPVGSRVTVLTGADLSDPNNPVGGTYTPATLTAATNSVTFSITHGQTARVFINALSSAQTLTIVESATAGWDPTAQISCSNVRGTPNATTNNGTRTISAPLSQTNSAAACTITNTKLPTLQLTKVTTGDVGTFPFTGTNGWANQNITTTTAGVGVTGARQTLTAANTATTITEGAVAGYRMANVSCSGLGAGGTFTPDLTNRTIAFNAAAMAPGSDISCTVTNARQRTLTVTKSLAPLADPGQFIMNANGTTGAAAGNGATANALVDVGTTATFSEAGSGGTLLANYTSSFSCNTAPVTAGSGTSGSFTMPNADVACTLTNTRRSATLTLRTAWTNAIVGDTATTASTGFGTNATSGASVSTGNNTTTGAAVTVYAGESGPIASTFSVGNSANYDSTLSCTGNNTPLAGNTLTINPADTAVVCTVTHTRRSATLTLRKTWVNGASGDTATVAGSGFTNNGTSGASVSSGNNTTTGAAVTVFAAESGTITESFSVGSSANYTSTLACTGNSTPLAGNTLTVNPADTAIVCTVTNTRRSATLTLRKTWVNAINGDTATVSSTGFASSASSGAAVSTGNNTVTGVAVTVYAGESGAIGETFSVGSAANYNATLACSGNTTALAGSTLTVHPSDGAITCTMTNTRRSATLTLRKTWVNGITGNTATVTSTGFANNATSGASVSSGNNSTTGAAVTVYAGESGTVGEAFSVGNPANYSIGLSCSGNATALAGSTLTVDPADTAILCTVTNTRRSATLTLRKTWVGALVGDTATVSSSGFTHNATTGAAVSAGDNTVTGASVTVYAAESGTITESFSVGTPSQYTATLACTGTSGLSGNTLTIAPGDTAIQCTYTNSRSQPLLALFKWSTLISDPVNGNVGPKAIPGSVREYSFRVTNSGNGSVDSGTLVISDPLPPSVELFVNDLSGPGTGPVLFVDGTPASGLAWVFSSLASPTDSVDFSADNGATWTYVPVPDASGFDPAVTHIRLRPQGGMNAAGGGNPFAEFTIRVRQK